jgi:flagellar basal-body rod protein FlgG
MQAAASGMVAQMAGQDVVANNLANVNTSGFKRDVPSFRALLTGQLEGANTAQVSVDPGFDRSQGAIRETGSPTHFALDGDGYFAVQTPSGVACTRNGAFTLDSEGYLVTTSGDKVLGQSGPVQLAGKGEIKVSERGVLTQNGQDMDTLQVVRFAPTAPLGKTGDGLWRMDPSSTTIATDVRVRQGSLEASNVNPIEEMVSMIAGLRTYEASQKSIQAQDETLDKLVNEVGRT